jgi:hypothetical protein
MFLAEGWAEPIDRRGDRNALSREVSAVVVVVGDDISRFPKVYARYPSVRRSRLSSQQ